MRSSRTNSSIAAASVRSVKKTVCVIGGRLSSSGRRASWFVANGNVNGGMADGVHAAKAELDRIRQGKATFIAKAGREARDLVSELVEIAVPNV
jgi:hypothetical protein